MKTFRHILLLVLSLFGMTEIAGQSWTKPSDLSESEAKNVIEIAKRVFQNKMPEFYREYGMPIIEKYTISRVHSRYDANRWGDIIGKDCYIVTFPRDSINEARIFVEKYAAKVHIICDGMKAYKIEYGDSINSPYSEYLFIDW